MDGFISDGAYINAFANVLVFFGDAARYNFFYNYRKFLN